MRILFVLISELNKRTVQLKRNSFASSLQAYNRQSRMGFHYMRKSIHYFTFIFEFQSVCFSLE